MKVAIWGSFNHGNFGDYLMGLLIAGHLKSLGAEPWLYRYQAELAADRGFHTTESLEELFDRAGFGLAAGGTLLMEPHQGPVGSVFNHELRQLWETIQSTGLPFYCINVGGDGSSVADRRLSHFQWQIAKEGTLGGTVRLASDRALFEALGRSVEHWPDLAFGVAGRRPLVQRMDPGGRPLNVGISLPNSRRLSLALRSLAALRGHAVFHFLHPHFASAGYRHSSILPRESRRIRHHIFEEPTATIDLIASLDLLVCNYLHPVIVALAHCVPVLCADTRAKSVAVMEEAGYGFACPGQAGLGVTQLLRLLGSRRSINAYRSRFDFGLVRSLSERSNGHLQFLSRLVKHYGGPGSESRRHH